MTAQIVIIDRQRMIGTSPHFGVMRWIGSALRKSNAEKRYIMRWHVQLVLLVKLGPQERFKNNFSISQGGCHLARLRPPPRGQAPKGTRLSDLEAFLGRDRTIGWVIVRGFAPNKLQGHL